MCQAGWLGRGIPKELCISPWARAGAEELLGCVFPSLDQGLPVHPTSAG